MTMEDLDQRLMDLADEALEAGLSADEIIAAFRIAAHGIQRRAGRRMNLRRTILIAAAALVCVAAAFVACSNTAYAQDRSKWPGPFPVDILAVLDGDTVEVRFGDGPCTAGGRGAPCPGSVLALRLAGIDTPRSASAVPRNRRAARPARRRRHSGPRPRSSSRAPCRGRRQPAPAG